MGIKIKMMGKEYDAATCSHEEAHKLLKYLQAQSKRDSVRGELMAKLEDEVMEIMSLLPSTLELDNPNRLWQAMPGAALLMRRLGVEETFDPSRHAIP